MRVTIDFPNVETARAFLESLEGEDMWLDLINEEFLEQFVPFIDAQTGTVTFDKAEPIDDPAEEE